MFQPVQVEEMAFAMTLFLRAASGQLSSGQKPLSVKNKDEGVRLFVSLADIAAPKRGEELAHALDTDLFRAFLIVWEHYRNDAFQKSIGARLLGFYHLMIRTQGKALETWTEPSPVTEEMVELHPLVVETIAAVELAEDGRLDEAKFLDNLKGAGSTSAAKADPRNKNGAWPVGSSELAKLIRGMDWSRTPLGPMSGWPQSLRTAVDLILACRFPMVVLWGEALIQIYNDGYCDLMGEKHPEGLGQATRDCWPEVWHINEPIYRRVLAGETVTIEDGLYPIRRHGHFENAYFTLCYSALRDESASISGILVTVFETTERVEAEMNKVRQ